MQVGILLFDYQDVYFLDSESEVKYSCQKLSDVYIEEPLEKLQIIGPNTSGSHLFTR